jgi:hypothetical protein
VNPSTLFPAIERAPSLFKLRSGPQIGNYPWRTIALVLWKEGICQVAETVAPARPPQPAPRPATFQIGPRSSAGWITLLVILLGIVGFVCYARGFGAGAGDLDREKQAVAEKTALITKQQRDIQAKDAQIKDQQQKLDEANKQLNELFNSYRTVELKANESTRISMGYFPIGLIGFTSTDQLSINVNGTQHEVKVGERIDVGAAIRCQAWINSFELMKASVVTTCAPATP